MSDHARPDDPARLQQLVDFEDLDGLLELVSPEEIAEAWCRYTADDDHELDDHPDWWAIDLFFTTEIFRRSDLYRTLLLRMLEHPDPDMDWAVAAGPLENFVSDNPDDLAWLERECATNPRLRRALTGTAAASYVSTETLWRLDAAVGEPLTRPFRGPVDAAHAEQIRAAPERPGGGRRCQCLHHHDGRTHSGTGGCDRCPLVSHARTPGSAPSTVTLRRVRGTRTSLPTRPTGLVTNWS